MHHANSEPASSTGPDGRKPSQFRDNEMTGGFMAVAEVIVKNIKWLLLIPIGAAVTMFALTFLMTPIFTATVRFLPPQQQQSAAASLIQSLGALGSLAGGGASALKNPTDQYIAFLKTEAVQDALISRFQLTDRYEAKYLQDVRNILEKLTEINAGKDGIIVVKVDDRDPKFAADLANAYVEELGRLLNRLAVTEAQQRRVFFEGQLLSAKNGLIKAEQVLAASGVSTSALNASPTTAMEGPARLRAQVTALEVKLSSMRSYLTEKSAEYRQVQAELAAVRAQLAKAERTQPDGNGSRDDYISKYREFKYQETLFELFSRQYEIAKIDESREGAIVQVIDPAKPPERKAKPKRAFLILASGVLTGFLVLIFIFARHAYRRAMRDPAFAGQMQKLHAN